MRFILYDSGHKPYSAFLSTIRIRIWAVVYCAIPRSSVLSAGTGRSFSSSPVPALGEPRECVLRWAVSLPLYRVFSLPRMGRAQSKQLN